MCAGKTSSIGQTAIDIALAGKWNPGNTAHKLRSRSEVRQLAGRALPLPGDRSIAAPSSVGDLT